eukprot:jgi/Botrbrau1/9292/Bobra.0111s0017.1
MDYHGCLPRSSVLLQTILGLLITSTAQGASTGGCQRHPLLGAACIMIVTQSAQYTGCQGPQSFTQDDLCCEPARNFVEDHCACDPTATVLAAVSGVDLAQAVRTIISTPCAAGLNDVTCGIVCPSTLPSGVPAPVQGI